MFVRSVGQSLSSPVEGMERSVAVISQWSRRGNRRLEAISQLGKRYRCSVCGTEILCTKAGEGTVACCGKEMEVQESKPLPSSD